MRLDKYLKVSRLIKRRTIANEACEQGKIFINSKVAKPAAEVKVGDRIELKFGEKVLEIEVTIVSEHAAKADASMMYSVIRG